MELPLLYLIRLTAILALLSGHVIAQTINRFDLAKAKAGLIEAKANLEEAKAAIDKSNNSYFQAFVNGDSSLFINRYTKDCWIMPPNSPSLAGPDAPLFFFRKAYYDIGLRNGNFTTIDVYGISKDMVAEVGFWQSFNAANVQFDNGKYLVLWKKTAKGWKMYRDSFSSDNDQRSPHLP